LRTPMLSRRRSALRRPVVRCALSCSSLLFFFHSYGDPRDLHSFPTRRSSDLPSWVSVVKASSPPVASTRAASASTGASSATYTRSEEHTSELQSPDHLVCRLLLEKKKKKTTRLQKPA